MTKLGKAIGGALVAVFATTSCAGSMSAPPSLVGDVPFVVTNNTDMRMCEFHMVPAASSDAGANWVGLLVVEPNATKEFKLEAGDHRISAKGCGPSFGAAMSLTLRQPTHVTFGLGRPPPIGPGTRMSSSPSGWRRSRAERPASTRTIIPKTAGLHRAASNEATSTLAPTGSSSVSDVAPAWSSPDAASV